MTRRAAPALALALAVGAAGPLGTMTMAATGQSTATARATRPASRPLATIPTNASVVGMAPFPWLARQETAAAPLVTAAPAVPPVARDRASGHLVIIAPAAAPAADAAVTSVFVVRGAQAERLRFPRASAVAEPADRTPQP
jgi:hypothetical protein